jgi:predicted GIY-YIG superfamily endonuclease
MTERPVALYRHLDPRGELLYVGITTDLPRRWAQHRELSLWARFVSYTHVCWYSTRAEAEAAERSAIRYEEPLFNTKRPAGCTQHNDRKVRYLSTGVSGAWRRVPCRTFPAEFCVTCGPDAEAFIETSLSAAVAAV